MKKIILSFFISFILSSKVKLGIENLLDNQKILNELKGKKIGLISNATGINSQLKSTINLLYNHPDINLTVLFAPEHGIRSELKAGEFIKDNKDKGTNLPIISLYGKNSKTPKKADLDKVDIIIYDIQDIGARTYTYIWTLAKTLEICGKYNKYVWILDRPDIFGANTVDGGIVEKAYFSFIGLYPIPRIYGMTVGELAYFLNKEYNFNCPMSIIKMSNYKRGMTWQETGLPWVPTSPFIPSLTSALCYSMTGGLGVTSQVNIGIGYTLPFQVIAAPWINEIHMKKILSSFNLPGLIFREIHFVPHFGLYKGEKVKGVQIHIMDSEKILPATTEIALFYYLYKFYPRYFHLKEKFTLILKKVFGNDKTFNLLKKKYFYKRIVNSWLKEKKEFLRKRKKYLLY